MTGLALILLFVGLAIGFYLWLSAGTEGALKTISDGELKLCDPVRRLVGKPDRIFQLPDGRWIPVEKKSGSKVVRDSHLLQLGVYLLLVEAKTGSRPPYGMIALADDREVEIENSESLRDRVMATVAAMRADRAGSPATPFPAKCSRCGVRNSCIYGV